MSHLTIQIAQEKIKQAKTLLEEADMLIESTKSKEEKKSEVKG